MYRNFVNLGPSTNNIGLDMGLVIGSFSGSVLVSLIAIKAVHWFHVPNHVLTIPSVIPMIPGSSDVPHAVWSDQHECTVHRSGYSVDEGY